MLLLLIILIPICPTNVINIHEHIQIYSCSSYEGYENQFQLYKFISIIKITYCFIFGTIQVLIVIYICRMTSVVNYYLL